MIRTKIVATLGPACGDVETLFRLFEAGADICRLNFSHGKLEQHLLMLRNIREAAARFSFLLSIPAIAEPWMLAFNAGIALHPVMVPDDLAKAASAIEKAVKKFA